MKGGSRAWDAGEVHSSAEVTRPREESLAVVKCSIYSLDSDCGFKACGFGSGLGACTCSLAAVIQFGTLIRGPHRRCKCISG